MVAAVAESTLTVHVPPLFPRQYRFFADESKYPAYIGGIGSGKSFAGASKVLNRIGEVDPGLVVAPTYPMLRDSTQRTLLAILRQSGLEFRHYKSDKLILVVSTGHEIMLRSADDEDSLRGPNCAYAYVDEAALITARAWQVIKGRVRVGSNPQAWVTGTPKGRNWIWEEWERDAQGNESDLLHPLYRVRSDENPELPADFVGGLGYEGRFYEQEIEGRFVAFEGLVYLGFSRDRNVRSVDTDGWSVGLSLDVGTNNPTALLTFAFGSDRIHQSRELYQRGLGASTIVDLAVDEYRNKRAEWIVVDPSAAGIIADLTALGCTVRRAQNAVIEGISRVTSALPTITIDPSCVFTIAEYESYQYPTNGTKDIPLKANDHAMDATRYFVMEVTAGQRMVSVAPQGLAQTSDWR